MSAHTRSRAINRRQFLVGSAAAGAGLLLRAQEGWAMTDTKSRVALLKTEDRKAGVASSLRALGVNPAQGKHVVIKPNWNTADEVPGSTHNDTLVALVEELWRMGARSVIVGERSYPQTREVMAAKGVLPLLDRVAADAVGVAVLKSLGSNPAIMKPRIFEQRQIARAAELGLGAASASAIELVAADDASRDVRDRIERVLRQG